MKLKKTFNEVVCYSAFKLINGQYAYNELDLLVGKENIEEDVFYTIFKLLINNQNNNFYRIFVVTEKGLAITKRIKFLADYLDSEQLA